MVSRAESGAAPTSMRVIRRRLRLIRPGRPRGQIACFAAGRGSTRPPPTCARRIASATRRRTVASTLGFAVRARRCGANCLLFLQLPSRHADAIKNRSGLIFSSSPFPKTRAERAPEKQGPRPGASGPFGKERTGAGRSSTRRVFRPIARTPWARTAPADALVFQVCWSPRAEAHGTATEARKRADRWRSDRTGRSAAFSARCRGLQPAAPDGPGKPAPGKTPPCPRVGPGDALSRQPWSPRRAGEAGSRGIGARAQVPSRVAEAIAARRNV